MQDIKFTLEAETTISELAEEMLMAVAGGFRALGTKGGFVDGTGEDLPPLV